MRSITIRSNRSLAHKGPICQFCQFSTAVPFQLLTRDGPAPSSIPRCRTPPGSSPLGALQSKIRLSSRSTGSQLPNRPERTLELVKQEVESIKSSDQVPSESRIVELLHKCQQIVDGLTANGQLGSQDNLPTHNATSSLLGLEEKAASAQRMKISGDQVRRVGHEIAKITNSLLEDDKVFISPDALGIYTRINTKLKQADRFPMIFSLYANKPLPEPNTSPIKYRQPTPKSVKNAVPTELAQMALGVAVEQKNLPLALAIIDSSFSAPAFYRAKFFKKAALPITGLVTAPLASYVLATWSASLQNTMDPNMATGIAFTAILAYVTFTSSVGLVAVATANDQMERVVWASGVPLRYRWLREEERAALDKIAVAWGFKEAWRRGEEEGEEWENLREFIGMRGMVLDKSDLMEGMQ